MKKYALVFLTLAAAVLFASCAATAPPSQLSPEPAPRSGEESGAASAPEPAESERSGADGAEKIYVADAAMYRGTVASLEMDGETRALRLEQAEGTDFGAASLRFRITPDSSLSFELEQLEAGAYLEVFYGVAPGQPFDQEEVIDVIGANLYPDAALVNFNGVVLELLPDADRPGEGQLVMEGLKDGQTVVFHYSGETQFYLDQSALAAGDKLNILHKGILTRSLPPQGIPLEVRSYTQPAV